MSEIAARVDAESAYIWRNDSDGEPQIRVTMPDGYGPPIWLRIPKSSRQAYARAVAALDHYKEREARHGDFDYRIVGHIDLDDAAS